MQDLVLITVGLSWLIGVVWLYREMRPLLATRPPNAFGALLFGFGPLLLWVWVQEDELSATHINWDPAWVLLPFAAASAVAGYGIARSLGRSWMRYLLESVGWAVALAAVGMVALSLRGDMESLRNPPDVLTLTAILIVLVMPWCLISSIVLRILVNWSKKSAAQKPSPAVMHANENPLPDGNTKHRFALASLTALGLPALLAIPAVLLLRHDTNMRSSANTLLTQSIGSIDTQITDLKDLNKIRSQLFVRKQIIETLENDAVHQADVLGILGEWPDSVQLVTLKLTSQQISIAIRAATPADELAFLERLARRGYRNLTIAARQRDGVSEQVTFEATLPHGDSK
ncbi:MAG: hypothetical protein ABI411_03225 [Tahibacter sp.]